MKKHYRQENDCLNCGTLLEGKFCYNCGQENLQMKESFGHMLNHAVSDYFHFDDQFFHTLKPLLFSPGKLTTEYLLGRRASYLHPVKMYIFISLIFFLLFLGQSANDIIRTDDNEKTETHAADSVKRAIAAKVDNNNNLTPAQKAELKESVKGLFKNVAKEGDSTAKSKKDLKAKVATAEKKPGNFNRTFNIAGSQDSSKTYAEYLTKQSKLSPEKRDGFLMRYIKKKGFDWQSHGKDSEEIFIEAYKHNIPKLMFVLLPLFALLLSIAFVKNKKFYVEHIIYAIHLHCFIFLFLTIKIILDMIAPAGWESFTGFIDFVSFLAIVYYIYRSLRVVYNRSRWRTISKMFGISFMYLIVFTFCFVVFIAITVAISI